MAERKKPFPLRTAIQLAAACLQNGYLKGFLHGKIYQGPIKRLCAPGLNCYSCPGALGACPMGALQNALSGRQWEAVLYLFGFLTLMGTLFGRLICGFLCPFGLIQDLLFHIPFLRKLRSLPGEKGLRLLRYLVLALFVILLPLFALDAFGLGMPWFCKFLCPAGTLEAGIPLVAMNTALAKAVGFLYTWKIGILVLVVILSLLLCRPFCRYLCPLGALYGLFNPVSFYRFFVDEEKCTRCGKCRRSCPMDIPVWEKPNSTDCIRCGKCKEVCPRGAIGTLLPFPRKKK